MNASVFVFLPWGSVIGSGFGGRVVSEGGFGGDVGMSGLRPGEGVSECW